MSNEKVGLSDIVEYIPVLVNVTMIAMLVIGVILTSVGLPGNLFILLLAVVYGWQEGFSQLTYSWLLILAGMWLSGELLEFFAGVRGAKKARASKWATIAAVVGSIAGGIIGTGILPIIGTVIGAVLGGFAASYCAEYIYTSDKIKAQQVAKGVLKGQLLGMLIKLAVAIGMTVMISYKLWF